MSESFKNHIFIELNEKLAGIIEDKSKRKFVEAVVHKALRKLSDYMHSDYGEVVSYRLTTFFGIEYSYDHHKFHQKLSDWFKEEAKNISLETSIDDASEILFRKFKKKVEH